jgi:Iron-dependent Transcriptional regulator
VREVEEPVHGAVDLPLEEPLANQPGIGSLHVYRVIHGLARAARDIAVLEIILAIDGAGIEGRCVLGFSECSDATPCPAHPVWKPAKELLARQLENRSLDDLARSVERKRARAARRR